LYDHSAANALKEELQLVWSHEEQYWAMRLNWLKWGDKNTKFFHATTIQRRQRNRITMLQDDNHCWVRDPTTLQEMATTFFSRLYTTAGHRNYEPILSQCPSMVTHEMNQRLIATVTIEEVHQATFQLGATKAPGPDGLNGLFYQMHWDIIKTDLF